LATVGFGGAAASVVAGAAAALGAGAAAGFGAGFSAAGAGAFSAGAGVGFVSSDTGTSVRDISKKFLTSQGSCHSAGNFFISSTMLVLKKILTE
jgi:hypothetical protein